MSSVTTDPLEPDYYTYSLGVDGNSLNDPGNRTVQNGFGNFQSMFVVPGSEPWLPSDVSHGAIDVRAEGVSARCEVSGVSL